MTCLIADPSQPWTPTISPADLDIPPTPWCPRFSLTSRATDNGPVQLPYRCPKCGGPACGRQCQKPPAPPNTPVQHKVAASLDVGRNSTQSAWKCPYCGKPVCKGDCEEPKK